MNTIEIIALIIYLLIWLLVGVNYLKKKSISRMNTLSLNWLIAHFILIFVILVISGIIYLYHLIKLK